MRNAMPKDDKTAQAIRAHVRSILLRLRVELRSSTLTSRAQDRSVEVEGQEKKTLLIHDL